MKRGQSSSASNNYRNDNSNIKNEANTNDNEMQTKTESKKGKSKNKNKTKSKTKDKNKNSSKNESKPSTVKEKEKEKEKDKKKKKKDKEKSKRGKNRSKNEMNDSESSTIDNENQAKSKKRNECGSESKKRNGTAKDKNKKRTHLTRKNKNKSKNENSKPNTSSKKHKKDKETKGMKGDTELYSPSMDYSNQYNVSSPESDTRSLLCETLEGTADDGSQSNASFSDMDRSLSPVLLTPVTRKRERRGKRSEYGNNGNEHHSNRQKHRMHHVDNRGGNRGRNHHGIDSKQLPRGNQGSRLKGKGRNESMTSEVFSMNFIDDDLECNSIIVDSGKVNTPNKSKDKYSDSNSLSDDNESHSSSEYVPQPRIDSPRSCSTDGVSDGYSQQATHDPSSNDKYSVDIPQLPGRVKSAKREEEKENGNNSNGRSKRGKHQRHGRYGIDSWGNFHSNERNARDSRQGRKARSSRLNAFDNLFNDHDMLASVSNRNSNFNDVASPKWRTNLNTNRNKNGNRLSLLNRHGGRSNKSRNSFDRDYFENSNLNENKNEIDVGDGSTDSRDKRRHKTGKKTKMNDNSNNMNDDELEKTPKHNKTGEPRLSRKRTLDDINGDSEMGNEHEDNIDDNGNDNDHDTETPPLKKRRVTITRAKNSNKCSNSNNNEDVINKQHRGQRKVTASVEEKNENEFRMKQGSSRSLHSVYQMQKENDNDKNENEHISHSSSMNLTMNRESSKNSKINNDLQNEKGNIEFEKKDNHNSSRGSQMRSIKENNMIMNRGAYKRENRNTVSGDEETDMGDLEMNWDNGNVVNKRKHNGSELSLKNKLSPITIGGDNDNHGTLEIEMRPDCGVDVESRNALFSSINGSTNEHYNETDNDNDNDNGNNNNKRSHSSPARKIHLQPVQSRQSSASPSMTSSGAMLMQKKNQLSPVAEISSNLNNSNDNRKEKQAPNIHDERKEASKRMRSRMSSRNNCGKSPLPAQPRFDTQLNVNNSLLNIGHHMHFDKFENKQIEEDRMKNCSNCTLLNPRDAKRCSACNYQFKNNGSDDIIKCPRCTYHNVRNAKHCEMCRTMLNGVDNNKQKKAIASNSDMKKSLSSTNVKETGNENAQADGKFTDTDDEEYDIGGFGSEFEIHVPVLPPNDDSEDDIVDVCTTFSFFCVDWD